LRSAVKPDVLQPLLSVKRNEEETAPIISVEGEEKLVTVNKPEEPSKTRKLKRKGGVSTNEFSQIKEGIPEGTT
jgi:hypothetical protein